MGDETVVEAPVDEDATEAAVADEDLLETEQSDDALSGSSMYFNKDNITTGSDYVCDFYDYSGLDGSVSLFANGSQVYHDDVTGETNVRILAKDLFGKFYGTYNMNLVYYCADGKNRTEDATVNFAEVIKNNPVAEDFNVTFPTTEFDMDKEDPVIITYFTPEGIPTYFSYILVYNDKGFEIFRNELLLSKVGTYTNITWGDLRKKDLGVYNISVCYCEDAKGFVEVANTTLNVTYNHMYTADEFIYIYDYVGNGFDEDWLAEIYDDEIKGLDGVVTAYANGNKIYTKEYAKYNKGGPININDLSGSFDGAYTIKIEYKRTDGKVFTVSNEVYFDNVVGGSFNSDYTNPISIISVNGIQHKQGFDSYPKGCQ
jgi:hypothetical protein